LVAHCCWWLILAAPLSGHARPVVACGCTCWWVAALLLQPTLALLYQFHTCLCAIGGPLLLARCCWWLALAAALTGAHAHRQLLHVVAPAGGWKLLLLPPTLKLLSRFHTCLYGVGGPLLLAHCCWWLALAAALSGRPRPVVACCCACQRVEALLLWCCCAGSTPAYVERKGPLLLAHCCWWLALAAALSGRTCPLVACGCICWWVDALLHQPSFVLLYSFHTCFCGTGGPLLLAHCC
jgi:hypothetical protein